MKKTTTVKIVIVIGVLSILAGAWQAYNGKPFQDYFFSLFIGVTLIGTGWITERGSEEE